jgi:2-C-methyl-D-erythritol 2,4-cyclodiphosphate synthase
MRANLAAILEVDPADINIKATTGEKMGFVGREEGMMAEAVVLLERKETF